MMTILLRRYGVKHYPWLNIRNLTQECVRSQTKMNIGSALSNLTSEDNLFLPENSEVVTDSPNLIDG